MAPPTAEAERYARQRLLPGLGAEGLARLREARVHVVGAGACGGPALLLLAQAGVGTLYLDDGADVGPGDEAAWLYTPAHLGQPRLLAGLAALRAASAHVAVRAYATGSEVTATLVAAVSEGLARTAAEQARLAGVPHVVALATGEGGHLVTIPSGAPCYACASRPGAGTLPRGGTAAAIGGLGALELLLLVAGALPDPRAGRRLDLVEGRLEATATARRPGCDCRNVY